MSFFQELSDNQIAVGQGEIFLDILFPAIDARVNAVVITPTCDIIQKKAHFIKFISTVSLEFVIKIIADSVNIEESYFNTEIRLTRAKHQSILKMLRRNTTGTFLPRYYLLPKFNELLPASFLDFQMVFVVPLLQVNEDYLDNRIVRVNTPWRESIASQYASYSMRIGTPDYSDEELNRIFTQSGLKLPNGNDTQS